MDYEAELAVIIKKDAKDVKPGEVKDYIFGYTIMNDVSAREVQTEHKQWYFGKSLDGFFPNGTMYHNSGRYPISAKAFYPVPRQWGIKTDSNTELLIFGIDHIVSELSKGMTLKPGTIIATGTPAGAGNGDLHRPDF